MNEICNNAYTYRPPGRQHRLRARHGIRRAIGRSNRLALLSLIFFDELRWSVTDVYPCKLAVIASNFSSLTPPSPNEQRNRLLFVDRMDNLQNNFPLLSDIWVRRQVMLPDGELHLVGDKPDLAELKAMFAARGLPRVVFHGRADPTSHYRAARLFLKVSAYEGFGNTLIVSQPQGAVPIAVDTYSALRWILHDGTDAWIILPGDVIAFAEAVLLLAEDTELQGAMSRAGIANSARFCEAHIGAQWEALCADFGVGLRTVDNV